MKTEGGRAFLHGHPFGDNVHEYLAPCIYEGEGEMLGMGFFKSLIKEHGKTYFEPIGRDPRHAAAIKRPNLLNPAHFLGAQATPPGRVREMAGRQGVRGRVSHTALPRDARRSLLLDHARVRRSTALSARPGWRSARTCRKHQLKLADRQCRMSELSSAASRTWSSCSRRASGPPASPSEARPRRGRHPLPGPRPQAHRQAAKRFLLPRRDQAWRDDRRRRLRGDRPHPARADPDALFRGEAGRGGRLIEISMSIEKHS